MKAKAKYCIPLAALILCSCHNPKSYYSAKNKDSLSVYDYAEIKTGTNAEMIAEIAYAETRGEKYPDKTKAGQGGHDRGRFGLRELKSIRAERVRKYGKYDPHNPGQAAIVVGYILRDNMAYCDRYIKALKPRLNTAYRNELDSPEDMAISMYNQGIRGYFLHGINRGYVDKVREGMAKYGR